MGVASPPRVRILAATRRFSGVFGDRKPVAATSQPNTFEELPKHTGNFREYFAQSTTPISGVANQNLAHAAHAPVTAQAAHATPEAVKRRKGRAAPMRVIDHEA